MDLLGNFYPDKTKSCVSVWVSLLAAVFTLYVFFQVLTLYFDAASQLYARDFPALYLLGGKHGGRAIS
jgi:hypothetical protein